MIDEKKVEEAALSRFPENFIVQGLNIPKVARNAFADGAEFQAEQSENESIEFNEWCQYKGYRFYCDIQKWEHHDDLESNNLLTTQQLFQLWKTQQEK